jgi:hypothetical protein
MKITVKWSRLGRAMLEEWAEWIRQTPGGGEERVDFERTQLIRELGRSRGRPSGSVEVPSSEAGAAEYLWDYSDVTVRYRVRDRRPGVFLGVVREIVVVGIGIRLA